MSEKTPGQIAYEADVAATPLYLTGNPRKSWRQLSKIDRAIWNDGAKKKGKDALIADLVKALERARFQIYLNAPYGAAWQREAQEEIDAALARARGNT